MEVKNNDIISMRNDPSLVELIENFKKYLNHLRCKWLIILIFGISGGVLGLVASFIIKPKYTAHLSFALIEKSTGGGLADLASSFGFAGLLGGGSNGAFSGDNLLEIIKSKYAVEQTLLSPVNYKGKVENLIEAYIQFNNLQAKWDKNNKNLELKNLNYPLGQDRQTFTRTQDSILSEIYNVLYKSKALTVIRKDKKTSIVNMDFTSKDEVFSKLFIEQLMNQTYQFYKATKTSQSRANINMMQHTADSIKNLYEIALYKGAGISAANLNTALQYAAVPRIKQENNAQLYGTVYAEVLKNLETLKLDLARETPIVQIIDTPHYPLLKERFGHLKGIVIGGVLGGFLIIAYLIVSLYVKELIKEG